MPLEEVGQIPNEMLVAGDISIDGTKILLRQAHSEGRNYAFFLRNYCLLIITLLS